MVQGLGFRVWVFSGMFRGFRSRGLGLRVCKPRGTWAPSRRMGNPLGSKYTRYFYMDAFGTNYVSVFPSLEEAF